MYGYGRTERKKYLLQHTQFIKESLFERKGDLDLIDWLLLGKHYAKNGDEETAFQAYYMAHLLAHDKISTNGDLPFNTMEKS